MRFFSIKDSKDKSDIRANFKRAFFVLCVFFVSLRPVSGQHLRIFACAIANDSAGAFLGGSSNGSGLYQSDDTGKTWKHLGWENIKCYSMDAVDSSNGRILYEATGLGILRSTDYGEHWKQITDWRISEAMDVAVNQKNPDEIYIATAHGPWRTEDGGKTWEEVQGINPPYCSRVMYSPDALDLDDIVVCSETGIFWRSHSDKVWHTTINGPIRVRDIFFTDFIYHTSARGYRGTPHGLKPTPDSEVVHDWLVASEKDGLYTSSRGLQGFDESAGRHHHRMETMALWCVSEKDRDQLTGGPEGSDDTQLGGDLITIGENRSIRNVASCLVIGAKRTPISYSVETMLGTLGQGVYDDKQSLGGRQIWTLKSFLVTP